MHCTHTLCTVLIHYALYSLQGQNVLKKAWEVNAGAMDSQLVALAAQVGQAEKGLLQTVEGVQQAVRVRDSRGLGGGTVPTAGRSGESNQAESNQALRHTPRRTLRARLAEDDDDDDDDADVHDEMRQYTGGMLEIVSMQGSMSGGSMRGSPTRDVEQENVTEEGPAVGEGAAAGATLQQTSHTAAELTQCMHAIEKQQLQLASAYQERRGLMHGMQMHMHRMTDCLELLSEHTHHALPAPARSS
jgi:hypothetical protein